MGRFHRALVPEQGRFWVKVEIRFKICYMKTSQGTSRFLWNPNVQLTGDLFYNDPPHEVVLVFQTMPIIRAYLLVSV